MKKSNSSTSTPTYRLQRLVYRATRSIQRWLTSIGMVTSEGDQLCHDVDIKTVRNIQFQCTDWSAFGVRRSMSFGWAISFTRNLACCQNTDPDKIRKFYFFASTISTKRYVSSKFLERRPSRSQTWLNRLIGMHVMTTSCHIPLYITSHLFQQNLVTNEKYHVILTIFFY